MAEKGLSLKKALPIIATAWLLSLITTLALVYFSPSIFPPLGTQNIADTSITSPKIEDSAIVTAKLADGTVTSAKILDGTLTTIDLKDGVITEIKIADEAVTTNKIADNALNTSKIADNAVSTLKIADNAVVTAKLVDGTVTSAKILNGDITAQDLADGSVINMKIADGSVSTNKIADWAVTDLKLAPDAIPYFAMYNASYVSTSSTSFVDIPDTIVSITLNRKSNLLILFSAEAWVDGAGDELYVRALVNSVVANPNSGLLTLFTTAGEAQRGSYAVNFYLEDVAAGAYAIKVQWSEILGAGYAHMGDRTLHVVALPA